MNSGNRKANHGAAMLRSALVALGLAGALGSGAAAQMMPPTRRDASPIVIQNATILTVTRGTLENGSILIRDGKIAEVGRNVKAPAGARVIDARGMFVSPGIIDCHSHIAVSGGVNEGSVAVSSMAAIEDVIDPSDINIYRELAGGTTTSNVLHGSANPIGGLNAVIKHRWGADARGLLFEGAPPGIKFALGENPKRSNFTPQPGQQRRYPATRMGVMDVIREAFTEAREYKMQWEEYGRRAAAGDRAAIPPRRDLKLEPLVEILEGKRYVHSHGYRADEMVALMQVAEEFGFKVRTFQHVLEGYKITNEMKKHGAMASTFSDWWAYKIEAYEAIPYNAALMAQRGVVVSINSDSAEEARHLNQEAAKAMKWGGLNETEALKLVTLNPAIQLGIDRRVGSIEAGKDADLVIWDKHPLSVYAVAQKSIVDGVVYFDRQLDVAQRAEVAKEKKELAEKERRASEPPRREGPPGQQQRAPGQRRPPGEEWQPEAKEVRP
jgi:imidazolonepropionase-like amidohydrolase